MLPQGSHVGLRLHRYLPLSHRLLVQHNGKARHSRPTALGEGTRARLAANNAAGEVAAANKAAAAERQKRFRERRSAARADSINLDASYERSNATANAERASSRIVESLALSWFQQTANRGVSFQKLLPKILKHPIWRPVLSNYTDMEHALCTIGTIARGWQHIKGCHSKDD